MLFVLTMQAIMRKRHSRETRFDIVWTICSGAALLLNTAYVATEFVFGQEMWIVSAKQPGGQAAYLADHASVWYQTLGTAASILLNLLTHALMVRGSITHGRKMTESYRYTGVTSSGVVSWSSSFRAFYTCPPSVC